MPQNNVDLVNIYSPSELATLTAAQVQATTHFVCVYPSAIAVIGDIKRVNIATLLQTMIDDRLGGGPPAFYQSLAFTPTIKFDSYITRYEQKTIDSPVTFTPVTDGARPGSEAILRLIADGVNFPNFSAFNESNGSAQYDNRVGVLNVVNFYFDGTEYWYSVFQKLGATSAPIADTTPPTLVSVSIDSATPGVVRLLYSESLNTTTAPAASAYTVSGSTAQSVAFANGNEIRVTFSPVLASGSSKTVSYAVPGTNPVRDLAGNNAAALSPQTFSLPANPPADTTPPTLVNVSIDSATPGVVSLLYSEALNTAAVPPVSAYTISGSTAQSVAFANGNEIRVTFSPVLDAGSSKTIAYAVPGTNPVRDPSNNAAAAFGPQSFSLPAAPIANQQPLTFVTRTSNITQDTNGLTATSPSYSNTFALGDFYIDTGTDGNFEMAVLGTQNRDIIMGLNAHEINQSFQGYEYFLWMGGSAGDVKKGTNGATGPATTVFPVAGSKLRIGRFGGVVKGQYSSDGTNWTDIITWDTNPTRLYINVAMQNTNLSNPKITGGVAR